MGRGRAYQQIRSPTTERKLVLRACTSGALAADVLAWDLGHVGALAIVG